MIAHADALPLVAADQVIDAVDQRAELVGVHASHRAVGEELAKLADAHATDRRLEADVAATAHPLELVLAPTLARIAADDLGAALEVQVVDLATRLEHRAVGPHAVERGRVGDHARTRAARPVHVGHQDAAALGHDLHALDAGESASMIAVQRDLGAVLEVERQVPAAAHVHLVAVAGADVAVPPHVDRRLRFEVKDPDFAVRADLDPIAMGLERVRSDLDDIALGDAAILARHRTVLVGVGSDFHGSRLRVCWLRRGRASCGPPPWRRAGNCRGYRPGRA